MDPHSATKSLPSEQKAIVSTKYGKPAEALEYVTNWPVPSPKANQVLVKVSHSSVNPVDWKILKGALSLVIKLKHPYVVGADVSGEVVAVGSGAKRLKVGDRVYCDIGADSQGAYAQYVALPEHQLAIIPKSLSYAQAAAIPLVTLTSYQALKRYAQLKQGESVLLLGGSSGTGAHGVQLAKAFGAAHITTTCSSKNADFVKSLGADEVVAYDQAQWDTVENKYDVVFDCIGGIGVFDKAQKVLKPNGRFVTIAGDKQGNEQKDGKLDVQTALSVVGTVISRKLFSWFGKKIAYSYITLDAKSEKTRVELEDVSRLVEAGKLKPIIHETYKYEDVVSMWNESMKGRARGKLVIAINDLDGKSVQ